MTLPLKLDPSPRYAIGTRAIIHRDGAHRVVCATCNGGGSTPYPTRAAAFTAAVAQSNRPCQCKGCNAR